MVRPLSTTTLLVLSVMAPLAAALPVRAQPPPPPPPEAGEDEEPSADAEEIAALRAELAAQREELDAQRTALDALEAERAAAGDRPSANPEEDAELAAILEDVEGADGDVDVEGQDAEDPLGIYGFMDVGLQRTWGTNETDVLSASDESTFVLGNLNVYLDMHPVEDWRGLVEIRFTNLPNGFESSLETPISSYERLDTSIIDSSSPGGGFAVRRYGAIIMERAHIDWSPEERLVLRAGLFLTPYGIWNVDHGTPTLISLTFPVFQIVDLWPRQLIGVEASGVFHALPWEIGYHAWVSNGRTPTLVDLTDDKAVGGRLFLRTRRPFPMLFGVSGFFGSQEDQKKVVTDIATIALERRTVWAYDEQGLAADVSLDLGDLRLRSEVVFRQIFYEDGLRAPRFDTGPAVLLGEAADRREVGAYVLAAYQLPWYGIEPFVFVDFTKWPTPLGDGLIIGSVGFNIHFTEATLLKVQGSRAQFIDFEDHVSQPLGRHVNFVAARLVMAY